MDVIYGGDVPEYPDELSTHGRLKSTHNRRLCGRTQGMVATPQTWLPGREKSYSPFPVQEGTCRSLNILINERRGKDRKANLQIDPAPKSGPLHGQQSLSASSFNSGLPYPSHCDMKNLNL